ncbi:MAG: helix-turn-helix domain-containing protein [Actinomycetota bacterium]|nr:helix-turn-helix domain-containing protein [Actinomycetota bacterium]
MPTLKEFEKWLSTGQAAKALGRSRQGVIDLAEEKRLRAVKTAAGWLYDPKSVESFGAERMSHDLSADRMAREARADKAVSADEMAQELSAEKALRRAKADRRG